MPFTELRPIADDSPLLYQAAELIETYNRAARAFNQLEKDFPGLVQDREEIRRLAADLAAVFAKLTRKKYLVGFMGESGFGKSTAFNNVLDDVSEADKPAMKGAGGATTASVSRLHADPAGNKLCLRYMTPSEYAALRDHMCQAVGIQPGVLTDDGLLRMLPGRRDEALAGKGQQVALKSLEMLEKLLNARKRHPHLLADPPVVKDSEPYTKRDQHINYDKADPAPSNLLLDVVEIGLRSQRIVPELEMIDLPGLGQGARDTYQTRKFLPQLDGTLIFYKAQNFTEHVGEEAFASLREVFEGQIKGRVWLVVTYFDALTRDHLYGRRDNQVTAFDYLDKLLKDNRMTPDMVCFLSTKLYDPVQATGKNNDRLTAKCTLGIRDEDDYPPRLGQMDPALRTAFDELLKDGGIDHLRRLITHKVAHEVRQQTSQWCGRKLQSIQTDLTAVLRNEVKVAEMGDDWIIQVTTCRNRIRDVLETTLHRNPRFEEVATAMRDALARQFVEVFPNTPGQNRLLFQELGEEFSTHARILENQLEKTTSEKLVGSLYDDVGTKLTGLPAVEVLRVREPGRCLGGFSQGRPGRDRLARPAPFPHVSLRRFVPHFPSRSCRAIQRHRVPGVHAGEDPRDQPRGGPCHPHAAARTPGPAQPGPAETGRRHGAGAQRLHGAAPRRAAQDHPGSLTMKCPALHIDNVWMRVGNRDKPVSFAFGTELILEKDMGPAFALVIYWSKAHGFLKLCASQRRAGAQSEPFQEGVDALTRLLAEFQRDANVLAPRVLNDNQFLAVKTIPTGAFNLTFTVDTDHPDFDAFIGSLPGTEAVVPITLVAVAQKRGDAGKLDLRLESSPGERPQAPATYGGYVAIDVGNTATCVSCLREGLSEIKDIQLLNADVNRGTLEPPARAVPSNLRIDEIHTRANEDNYEQDSPDWAQWLIGTACTAGPASEGLVLGAKRLATSRDAGQRVTVFAFDERPRGKGPREPIPVLRRIPAELLVCRIFQRFQEATLSKPTRLAITYPSTLSRGELDNLSNAVYRGWLRSQREMQTPQLLDQQPERLLLQLDEAAAGAFFFLYRRIFQGAAGIPGFRYLYPQGLNLLIYDCGGGTTDIALVTARPDEVDPQRLAVTVRAQRPARIRRRQHHHRNLSPPQGQNGPQAGPRHALPGDRPRPPDHPDAATRRA